MGARREPPPWGSTEWGQVGGEHLHPLLLVPGAKARAGRELGVLACPAESGRQRWEPAGTWPAGSPVCLHTLGGCVAVLHGLVLRNALWCLVLENW